MRKPRKRDASKALRDLVVGLASYESEQSIAEVVRRAAEVTSSNAAYLERIDRERNEIVAVATFGGCLPPAGTRGPLNGSVAEAVLSSNEPILIANVARESRSILGQVNWPSAGLALPLVVWQKATIGVLILLRQTNFTAEEIGEIKLFADVAAVILHRSELLREAEMRRQRAEQALASRDQVFRIVTHDLRNPVNAIKMGLHALERFMFVPEADLLMGILRRSTQRVNRLLQDLADMTLIEQGRALPLDKRPHHLRDVADELCKLIDLASQQTQKDAKCTVEGESVIEADRDRLLQALNNVIDNAVKFTPQDGQVRVKVEGSSDNHVRFIVSDTGPGISEQDRERIFQPYWQAPSTAHLGSGLGLAIAKQIIEQHGGRIEVDSQPGQGTTFTITIPSYSN